MQNILVTLIVNCILTLIWLRYGSNTPAARCWRSETFLRGQHAAVIRAPWTRGRWLTFGIRVQCFALVGT